MQLEENLAKELAEIFKDQMAELRAHCMDQIVSWQEQIKGHEKRIAALEKATPQKGERGERGPEGLQGPIGLPGPQGVAGRDGLAGVPGRDGKDGAPGAAGRDGLDGKDGAPGRDGKDGAGPNRGRYRGPWKHDADYVLDDMVSINGSGFVAISDKPDTKPGTPNGAKDWQLFVKKGNDGKDGDRGPPGPAGATGKDGVSY